MGWPEREGHKKGEREGVRERAGNGVEI